MTEDEFWSLIENARRDGGSAAGQARLVREHLIGGSVEGLLAYRDRWDEAEASVFSWPIWDAASVLLGFVSDDFFSEIRAWIIGHGRATVARVAADPDALVELVDDIEAVEAGHAEALGMLVWQVWEQLTGYCGGGLPVSGRPPRGPTGSSIDLTDPEVVRRRFPRLAAFVQSSPPGWPRL